MQEDGVGLFWWDSRAAARPVALEVALVFAPQLNLLAVGQKAQFF